MTSGSAVFPILASPVDFGPMHLRNRIVCLPHGLNYAQPGVLRPTRRHRDYYAARARGGTGLVCLESSVSSWDGQPAANLVISSDAECIPGYREIVDAVHDAGARISGQITHFGHDAADALTREPLIAPSSLPNPLTGVTGRPMTRDDMERVIGDFTAAASNLVASGFDAVELKLAHDGLLRQFMSPLTNDRRDEYGGSTENRLCYPLAVLTAVHTALPEHVALGVRLVVDECVPGGYELDEGIEFARLLAASGCLDYISSDVGISASIAMVVPPMAVQDGYAEHAFSRLSEACHTPIVACGQIRTPSYAERILVEGRASAVGMARQMIADPEWASKALAGTPERIRPCTACNQLCLGASAQRRPLSCAVNPYAGFGEQRPRAAVAPVGQRVVVVGGGPAGMEAARVAAEDGHDVVLVEARAQLGGQLAVAARAHGRERWTAYLDWLEREIARLGVSIRREARLSAQQLLALVPERVIIATGSVPDPPNAPASVVVDVDSYLAGDARAPRVAVIDSGAAGPALWMTALESAHRGADAVTVVTRLATAGADLDAATAQWLRTRFASLPIRLLTEHAVSGFHRGSIVARSMWGDAEHELAADLVVVVTRRLALGDDLARDLGELVPVTVIGDALLPRDVTAAIREGQRAGSVFSNDGARRDRQRSAPVG